MKPDHVEFRVYHDGHPIHRKEVSIWELQSMSPEEKAKFLQELKEDGEQVLQIHLQAEAAVKEEQARQRKRRVVMYLLCYGTLLVLWVIAHRLAVIADRWLLM